MKNYFKNITNFNNKLIETTLKNVTSKHINFYLKFEWNFL